MNVSEFLEKSKSLIDSPEKWTQNAYYRNADDKPVGRDSPEACKFCMIGALRKTNSEEWLSNASYDAARSILASEVIKYTKHTGKEYFIPVFNDSNETTHDDVMKVFDSAIQTAKDFE